jgi:flavin-binding protein dodecin
MDNSALPADVLRTSPTVKDVTVVEPIDKINNLIQKEKNLKAVGVTRRKAYQVIADALDAYKWADVFDQQGNVKRAWVPDLEKQRWGAEMAVKMFGDMIERKEIEHDIGDKTLEKFRSFSVNDLRARAKAILEGSPVKRITMTTEQEEF